MLIMRDCRGDGKYVLFVLVERRDDRDTPIDPSSCTCTYPGYGRDAPIMVYIIDN